MAAVSWQEFLQFQGIRDDHVVEVRVDGGTIRQSIFTQLESAMEYAKLMQQDGRSVHMWRLYDQKRHIYTWDGEKFSR